MKDISSKVSIRPFTSAEDLAERTRPANVTKDNVGFMTITLKKPRSLRPYEPTQHRMKWSKEVEKMPSLDIMNKASSAASVGGALSNTKTSQWCSSSSNNNKNMLLCAFTEGDEHFMLPGSTGEAVAQQLHQGITLRICTSESYKRDKNSPTEKKSNKDFVLEHVPLCFDDELERQNVKVLMARPPTALPIVSETYPLIYNTDRYQHEPFKSPGFHFLNTPKPQLQNYCVLNSKSHSVIRITDPMQNVYMIRSQRKNQQNRGILYPQSSPHIGNKTMSARSVLVLSAEGNVTKYLNNDPLFFRRHDMPSAGVFSNTSQSQQSPFLMPRQRSITQVHVSPVVNGINPNRDAQRSPSDNLLTMTTGKLSRCSHVTPIQSQKSVATQNGTEWNFSKALQSNITSNIKHDFDAAKQQFHEEFREIPNISHNYEMTDDNNFELNEESISRPNSSAKHTFQDGAEVGTLDISHSMDDSNTCSETMGSGNDSETPKPNHHVQWSHAINIPTAESCK